MLLAENTACLHGLAGLVMLTRTACRLRIQHDELFRKMHELKVSRGACYCAQSCGKTE